VREAVGEGVRGFQHVVLGGEQRGRRGVRERVGEEGDRGADGGVVGGVVVSVFDAEAAGGVHAGEQEQQRGGGGGGAGAELEGERE